MLLAPDALSAADDGTLTVQGKSGRTLTLNSAWTNPTDDWRVGAKRLFDVVPGGLSSRVKAERKKLLDEAQRGEKSAAGGAAGLGGYQVRRM